MKGWSAFSKKTDPKLKNIAEALAKGAQEMAMERAGQVLHEGMPPSIEKMTRVKKDLVPKSKYTGRKPQSQMTDEELAAKKGIKAPQTTMKKKSAYKKKESEKTNKISFKEAVEYDKKMGNYGKEGSLTYGFKEGNKPGSWHALEGYEKTKGGHRTKTKKG